MRIDRIPDGHRLATALLLSGALLTAACGSRGSDEPATEASIAQRPPSLDRPVILLDLEGHPVDPFERGEARARVFVFVRTDCPISNRYAPEIKRLHDRYRDQGVDFNLVYVDPKQEVEEIEKHLSEYDYPMRPLRDITHGFVELTGVRVTPEAAVFVDDEAGMKLVYRGRIDNRYVDFGLFRPEATERDLADVLQAIVDGERVEPRTVAAVGCFIADLR